LSTLLPEIVVEKLREKQRKHVIQPAEPDAPAT
jgi:hypothetical protein